MELLLIQDANYRSPLACLHFGFPAKVVLGLFFTFILVHVSVVVVIGMTFKFIMFLG